MGTNGFHHGYQATRKRCPLVPTMDTKKRFFAIPWYPPWNYLYISTMGVRSVTASREGQKGCPDTLGQISADDLRRAAVELCASGILTCTRGNPGDLGATYALAWQPLAESDQYPPEVRDRHAANMARLLNPDDEVNG